MSIFVDYATKEDLASYMGVNIDELPKDVHILIRRASEFICISMRGNFKISNPDHVDAAKLAACAQCQDWLEREVSAVANNNMSSFSLGDLSISYSDVDKYANKLCTTAIRYLNSQHLLYRGVG